MCSEYRSKQRLRQSIQKVSKTRSLHPESNTVQRRVFRIHGMLGLVRKNYQAARSGFQFKRQGIESGPRHQTQTVQSTHIRRVRCHHLPLGTTHPVRRQRQLHHLVELVRRVEVEVGFGTLRLDHKCQVLPYERRQGFVVFDYFMGRFGLQIQPVQTRGKDCV